MIKEEVVQVRLNPANMKHYAQFGYCGSNGDFIEVLTKHLTKSSLTKITRICDICGKEKVLTRKRYFPVCQSCAAKQYKKETRKPKPHCVDCNVLLTNHGVTRCKACHSKWSVGENNPNYGNGAKIAGENNVNWKGGKPKCTDCGKTLSNGNYKDVVRLRCWACHSKFCRGNNHPSYKEENHTCPVCENVKSKNATKCNTCYLEEVHNPEYTGRRTADQNKFATEVKSRADDVCEICSNSYETMYAHHLESWGSNVDLRADPDNGVCLCFDCHLLFHKMYGFGRNTMKQYLEFKENYNGGS